MIKINTSRGPLDLGGDFTLSIEETSPIMNDRGSQSIPATVPASSRNARIFGHAHRVDMAKRPLADDATCTISDGVYFRRGKIHLVSAGRNEGYEFNVGLDNATAYSVWRAMRLSSLSLPTFAAGSVDALCAHLEAVMNGTVNDPDYAVFQVTTNVAEKTDTESVGVEVTTQVHEYLNEMTVTDPDTDAGDWTQVPQSLVWQARTRTILVDNEEVQVSLPAGYGVTPFIYVWKVIELVFAAYGYTLESNPFHTDETLRHLVILNNAADCCCTGTLHYRDLMPECTIDEFLDALHARFGMVYDTNSNTGIARILFVRDLVSPTIPPGYDYTTLRTAEPHITYEEPRQVHLSANRSLEGAAPPNDRYESFIRLSSGRIRSVARVRSDMAQPAWIMFERCTGRIWKYDQGSGLQAFVGSANFDWDRESDGVGNEDISSTDEMLPMDFAGNGILNPMYLAGYVHRYTEIKSSDVDVSDEDEQTSEMPLAFALAYIRPRNCYTFGSTLVHTPWGERVQLQEFQDIKSNAFYVHPAARIYGDPTPGISGNILAGDTENQVLAFEVEEGDVVRMSGLMSNSVNPSMCWAVYDEVITPASDASTEQALRAALIASASDPSCNHGRTNVSASITMPQGAAMLLVCVPTTGDTSTISIASGNQYAEHSLLWQFDTGLFAHYWREYDAMLRHAYNQVEVPIATTPADVMQTDLLMPVTFQGQYMLIDSMSYNLPCGKRIPVDMKFRTLRLIGPYDLDAEQSIPSLVDAEGHTYKWVIAVIEASWNEAARAEAIRAEWEASEQVTVDLNSYDIEYFGQTPAQYVAELLPPVAQTDTKHFTLTGRTVANISVHYPSGLETFDASGSYRPATVHIYLASEIDS